MEKKKLLDMKLGEVLEVNESPSYTIIRVLNGWIYKFYNQWGLTCCFVPETNDF